MQRLPPESCGFQLDGPTAEERADQHPGFGRQKSEQLADCPALAARIPQGAAGADRTSGVLSGEATDAPTVFAPIFEESFKGLAVLIVFLFFRREFDSVLDGIVYAAITAMGFAATENVLYNYRNGYIENGWAGFWTLVFIRVMLVGWLHPCFTAFTGIGLAIARTSRNMLVKIIAVPAGNTVAVMLHAFRTSPR